MSDEPEENTPTTPSAPGPAFVPPARGVYRDALEAQLARAEAKNEELKTELSELRASHAVAVRHVEVPVPAARVPTRLAVAIAFAVLGIVLQLVSIIGRLVYVS